MTKDNPVKLDTTTHQALKEYSAMKKIDMGDIIHDALMKNPEFTKKFNEVVFRK